MAATQSRGTLPRNPREAFHPVHGKAATYSRQSLRLSERSDAGRSAAFAPASASFRAILGDEIHDFAQRREDEAQAGLLTSLMAADSGWEVYVTQSGNEIVGFVAVHIDQETHLGEIRLNAVDPA
jgi:hypothetical protein